MAVEAIPNQPVAFDVITSEVCNDAFHQLIAEEDSHSFQVLADLGEQDAENFDMADNLDSWSVSPGGSWVWDSGQAVGQNGDISQDLPRLQARYQIEISIEAAGFFPALDPCEVYLAGNLIGVIRSSGVSTYYGSTSDIGTVLVRAPQDTQVRVDYISCKEVLDSLSVTAQDCLSDSVFPLTQQPDNVIGRTVIFDKVPNALDLYDCYTLAVRGQSQNLIQCPDFQCPDPLLFWNIPRGDYSFTSSGIQFVSSGGNQLFEFWQPFTVEPFSNEVLLAFQVSDGDFFLLETEITLENTSGAVYFTGFVTNNGITTFQIPAPPEQDLVVRFKGFFNTVPGQLISVTINEVRATGSEVKLISNSFQRQTCEPTMLITAADAVNKYGFKFPTGFAFSMRLEASMYGGPYSYDLTPYHNFEGRFGVIFSERKKSRTLRVAPIPEYLHDALSILVQCSDLKADDIRYINHGASYDPEWSTGTCLAPIELDLVVGQQNALESC